eukprot:14323697-Alexandrium_andersonii.AAC.1
MSARRTSTRSSMRTCTWLFLRRWPSRGCAPSCSGASMGPGQPRLAGKLSTPRLSRASALPGARPARAASTTRSET